MDNARELTSHLLSLLRLEQSAMADFLLALADFDDRRLWAGMGYSSLFYFLHRELKLSSGAAYHRKVAAELIQRFPDVVEPLRDGRLCLSSVVELARVLTRENLPEVLPRFFHASKQQAKVVAAEIAPQELVPQRMVVTAIAPPSAPSARGLPSSLVSSTALELNQSLHPGETPPVPGEVVSRAEPALAPSAIRSTAEPLTADLRRLHVTVSKRFLEKLDAARDALSHSHPNADAEAILEAGLDLLIERAAKRKGICTRPKAEKKSPPFASPPPRGAGEEKASRVIPAAVKREVWIRDEGRCQWPTADGGICGSSHRLQFDHIVPVARGGESSASGIRLLCRAHNDLAARQVFGDDWMDRFTRGAHTRPPRAAAPA